MLLNLSSDHSLKHHSYQLSQLKVVQLLDVYDLFAEVKRIYFKLFTLQRSPSSPTMYLDIGLFMVIVVVFFY